MFKEKTHMTYFYHLGLDARKKTTVLKSLSFQRTNLKTSCEIRKSRKHKDQIEILEITKLSNLIQRWFEVLRSKTLDFD